MVLRHQTMNLHLIEQLRVALVTQEAANSENRFRLFEPPFAEQVNENDSFDKLIVECEHAFYFALKDITGQECWHI